MIESEWKPVPGQTYMTSYEAKHVGPEVPESIVPETDPSALQAVGTPEADTPLLPLDLLLRESDAWVQSIEDANKKKDETPKSESWRLDELLAIHIDPDDLQELERRAQITGKPAWKFIFEDVVRTFLATTQVESDRAVDTEES